MTTIWIIGWLFSIGYFLKDASDDLFWFIVGVILAWFIWPLMLGQQLGKKFNAPN